MDIKRVSFGLLALLVAGVVVTGCKAPVVISHGASFGHCRGYCNKELFISKDSLAYVQKMNGDQPETKRNIKSIDKETYTKVVKQFDFRSFYLLDSVIGCPDCADGGAEWLEVKSGKNKKRVTFEYNKVPEQLKASVEQIKKIQAKMEEGN